MARSGIHGKLFGARLEVDWPRASSLTAAVAMNKKSSPRLLPNVHFSQEKILKRLAKNSGAVLGFAIRRFR
jgi:hypothetical protein